jgi:hypothetical protein
MGERLEVAELAAVCIIVIMFSIGGLVWAFFDGLLYPHILLDGLLLVLVCLLMGGIFSLMLFQLAKAEGWLAHLPFLRKKVQTQAAASSPADPPRPGN